MSDPVKGSVESFIVEEDDWAGHLTDPFRSNFLESLRKLPVETARRFPPPKRGKIPFGHELRVARRFLAGESTLFDPSAFSRLYHRFASASETAYYRAFVLNEALTSDQWSELIGTSERDSWIEQGLLRQSEGRLRSRFSLYSIGDITLIGDPETSNLLRRVLVGQDSFMMAEFMRAQGIGRVPRYLDVGPGSGVILLTVSPHGDECVGIDINERAVAISRLNAELNQIPCTVHLDDAIANGTRYGRFDLITWNTPFVFLPEDCKDTHYDGYGGEMGMEIPLKFIGVLPELLADGGTAYMAAAAPIMKTGENLLEPELERLASDTGHRIVENVSQFYWHNLYRDFHEQHGIRKFEHSFLELSPGPGGFERRNAPLATRLSDIARDIAFSIRK